MSRLLFLIDLEDGCVFECLKLLRGRYKTELDEISIYLQNPSDRITQFVELFGIHLHRADVSITINGTHKNSGFQNPIHLGSCNSYINPIVD